MVALGIVVPAVATLENQANECRRYYSTPEKEAGEAHCPALAEPPPPRNPVPDRKEWREEQDLLAQREMAEWARWAFIVSSVGVVISGLAVWLVRVNLDLQRRATKHALSAARAGWAAARITRGQSIAYVHATGLFVTPKQKESANALANPLFNMDARLKIQLKNIGQTVAKDVHVRFEIEPLTPNWKPFRELHEPKSVPAANIAPSQEPTVELSNQFSDDFKDTAREDIPDSQGVGMRWIRGEVIYNDINGNTYRSAFLYLVMFNTEAEGGPDDKIKGFDRSIGYPAFEMIKITEAEKPDI